MVWEIKQVIQTSGADSQKDPDNIRKQVTEACGLRWNAVCGENRMHGVKWGKTTRNRTC